MKPYYEHAGITIYHGDCREILPQLSRGLVITDPPYDIFTHAGAFTVSARLISSKVAVSGIVFSPLDSVLQTTQLLLKHSSTWTLIFCSVEMLGHYQASAPENYIRGGIWDRITNTPQYSGDRPAQGAEAIAIFNKKSGRMKWNGGGKAAIWRHAVEAGLKQHPTQKPLSLMKELVAQFAESDSVIYDPFCGSGSALIAAKDYSLHAIGIEIEEKYCEIAAKRLSQEVLQFT